MGRRRKSSDDIVSLFPFLSILACVIGTLTMIVTALALSQVEAPSAKDVAEAAAAEARLKQFRELQQQLAPLDAEINRLRKALAEAEAQRKKLAADEAGLRKARDQQRQQKDQANKKLAEIEDLQKRIAELQASIASVEQQIFTLQAELKKRADVPKEAAVRLQPTGSGRSLKPLFVECTGSGIVLHDGSEPKRISNADLNAGSSAYNSAMDKVKSQSGATLIFLIRADGVGSYRTASKLASERDVRHGKLPVPGQGVLDFTLLQKGGN
jgi:uncharacterized protein YlxW (UPF0749 family)